MEQFNLTKAFDDSVFSITGYVVNAMKQCNFTKAEIAQYEKDAMSDDYNYLLSVSADMIDKCNFRNSFDEDAVDDARDEIEDILADLADDMLNG